MESEIPNSASVMLSGQRAVTGATGAWNDLPQEEIRRNSRSITQVEGDNPMRMSADGNKHGYNRDTRITGLSSVLVP
jgi:hypothetical protein